MNLGVRKLEFVQELKVSFLGLLQFRETFRDSLVVLPLVVDGVGQDEAEVESGPIVVLGRLGTLPALKQQRYVVE